MYRPLYPRGHKWRGGLEAGPNYTPAPVPIPGQVLSVIISLITQTILAWALTRRIIAIHCWRDMPLAVFLNLAIYIDSFLFACGSAILVHGIGINNSISTCQAVILCCLVFYMSTKIFIYFYFVEKAYLVRGSSSPRLRNKLYQFNIYGAIGPYAVAAILCFVWRIYYIDKDGTCIVGHERRALIPIIAWELCINVYLTALFLRPLRNLYSYKTNAKPVLRIMARRTFIGSCLTLASSGANLTITMALNGERAWICLMLCTTDILFSVLVLHWVSEIDSRSKEPKQHRLSQTQGMSKPSGTRPPEPYSVVSRPNWIHQKWPWSGHSTVTTEITAGGNMGRVSLEDPKGITVHTQHEWNESPIAEVEAWNSSKDEKASDQTMLEKDWAHKVFETV